MRKLALLLICVGGYVMADELTHDCKPTGVHAQKPPTPVKTQATLTAPTQPSGSHSEAPVARNTVDGHSHRCPYDGTVWSHTAASHGDARAHTCPTCGRVQWDVYQQTRVSVLPAKPTVAYMLVQTSNCPGGVCPVQITPRKVVWRLFR